MTTTEGKQASSAKEVAKRNPMSWVQIVCVQCFSCDQPIATHPVFFWSVGVKALGFLGHFAVHKCMPNISAHFLICIDTWMLKSQSELFKFLLADIGKPKWQHIPCNKTEFILNPDLFVILCAPVHMELLPSDSGFLSRGRWGTLYFSCTAHSKQWLVWVWMPSLWPADKMERQSVDEMLRWWEGMGDWAGNGEEPWQQCNRWEVSFHHIASP